VNIAESSAVRGSISASRRVAALAESAAEANGRASVARRDEHDRGGGSAVDLISHDALAVAAIAEALYRPTPGALVSALAALVETLSAASVIDRLTGTRQSGVGSGQLEHETGAPIQRGSGHRRRGRPHRDLVGHSTASTASTAAALAAKRTRDAERDQRPRRSRSAPSAARTRARKARRERGRKQYVAEVARRGDDDEDRTQHHGLGSAACQGALNCGRNAAKKSSSWIQAARQHALANKRRPAPA